MKNYFINIIFILTCICFGCNDLFLEPEEDKNNISTFESLWSEVDQNYSYFEYKKIDWNVVYEKYKPKISNTLTQDELFDVLDDMLKELNDLHVGLQTSSRATRLELDTVKYHSNFDLQTLYSYVSFSGQKGAMAIGRMKRNEKIGYIHIDSFLDNQGGFSDIDNILISMNDAKGIIIDIRNNGGGNDANAKIIASRFCDTKKIFGYVAYRNGKKHSDFSIPEPMYFEPSGNYFSKPIILLTSRRVASSAEEFVYMMAECPNVTIIGDTTIGASGNPMVRELPNGWLVKISRWIQYTKELKILENIGFAPNFTIINSKSDFIIKNDKVLNKAIDLLK